MRTRHQLDRLGQIRISRYWSMLVGVGADHVGQHPGITWIGLRARDPMPVPIAVDRQRVHRQHPIAGRHQCTHQQTTIGLDPDHDERVVIVVGDDTTDQIVEPGDPGKIVADPGLATTSDLLAR